MDLLGDLRYALRLLRKTPVFTIAALGTLALGIGANTTIFSLVQTMLLRPLPYQNPDQVVMVWEDRTAAGFPRSVPAPGNYQDWRAMNRSFTDMAATAFAFSNITGDGTPEIVLGRRVTANFFSVLGVQPVIGRAFTESDDTSGARVVVISHALWQRRYGGDPGIVGRTISMSVERVGDVKHEVVGVAPPSFVHLNRDIDYWVPMQFSPEEATTRGNHFLEVVARLKPDVTVEAADSDMRAIAQRLSEQYPQSNRDLGAVVVPIREQVLGNTRVQVIALMTAAAAIVLIACANLASLLLARASVRRGEYAVRLSLGASRGRLARQVLVEALCLSIAGGVLGLAIPVLTTTFVERIVPIGLQSFAVSLMDWPLLAFAAALSITTGVLFSIGPALQSAHASTAEVLQQHARGNAGGRSRAFRDGLVVLQVAATLVLLVAAGLMLRTLANLNAIDLGFDANNLLTMQAPLMPKYADPITRPPFYERIIAGIRALPGVRGAAFGSMLPFQSPGYTRSFSVEGRSRSWRTSRTPGPCRDGRLSADASLTLVEGRLLDARDGADAPLAVVVNETLIRHSCRDNRHSADESGSTRRSHGAVIHHRRRCEGRPRAWIPAGLEARCLHDAGAGPTLLSDDQSDRARWRRPLDTRWLSSESFVSRSRPTNPLDPTDDRGDRPHCRRSPAATRCWSYSRAGADIASLGLYGLLAQTVSARAGRSGFAWRSALRGGV